MEAFKSIYQRAVERKGSVEMLQALTSKPLTSQQLAKIGDDRFLAEMSKKVFQSGFVWRVVVNKWDNFETLFFNFEIQKVLMLSPEMLEKKATDERIIRNATKVKTIYQNALMIHDIQIEKNITFAEFISQWPSTDIVGLWLYLKKHGSRLGGNTGAYSLRAIGKDTFLLSRDVEGYFRHNKLIEGGLTSLKNLKIIQACFNQWHQESDLSMQEISQILAYSVGDNHYGIRT